MEILLLVPKYFIFMIRLKKIQLKLILSGKMLQKELFVKIPKFFNLSDDFRIYE